MTIGKDDKPTIRGEMSRRPASTSKGSAGSRAERIAAAVQILAESFRQPVTAITIRAYDVGTDDVPIEAVEAAVMRAIKEAKFMPSVAELRILAGVVPPDTRALKAWQIVKEAISIYGSYRTVQFDDPIATAAVRSLGGWVEVCNTPSGEKLNTWLRQNFEKTYKALEASGVCEEQTWPLPGLPGAFGGVTGPAKVCQIAVGLPPHTRALVHKTEPAGRSAGYLGAEFGKIGNIE